MTHENPAKSDKTSGPENTTQSDQNLPLFDRIQRENSSRNFDYFAATDKNKDNSLSRDELAKGIINPDLSPAQREWMELMQSNFDVISKLSDPSKTTGITREDEQAVKYLSSIRGIVDQSIPTTLEFAKQNFSKLDVNGNGRIELTDVQKFEVTDGLSKATDPKSGLTRIDLEKIHNLKVLLTNMQPQVDARHYKGGWVADLSPTDLNTLTNQDVYDSAGQKYVRDTLIGPYGKPGWTDVAATVGFGALGFIVAPSKEGVQIGAEFGLGIAKDHREQTKNYYAARDGINFYQQYKKNGIDSLLSRVSRPEAMESARVADK